MRHRILTNFHAESQRITTEEIIRRLLEAVPVPKSGLTIMTNYERMRASDVIGFVILDPYFAIVQIYG